MGSDVQRRFPATDICCIIWFLCSGQRIVWCCYLRDTRCSGTLIGAADHVYPDCIMVAGEHGGRGKLQIRVAVPADSELIAAHNSKMAYETEGRMLESETARDGVLSVLEDPAKGWYLLAESDGVVVGQCLITLEWSDWRNGHYWWIQSVYIVPECRRTGVFSMIYAWISDEAHSRPDVSGLRLYVEQENLTAREAYHSLGMKKTPYVMYEDIFPENTAETKGKRAPEFSDL